MLLLYYDFPESRVIFFYVFTLGTHHIFWGTHTEDIQFKNLWHFNDHQHEKKKEREKKHTMMGCDTMLLASYNLVWQAKDI